MRHIEHDNFIWEYPNVLSEEKCDEILGLIQNSAVYDEYLSISAKKNRVRNNRCLNVTQAATVDNDMRRADSEIDDIFGKIHKNYIETNKNYFTLGGCDYLLQTQCKYTFRTYDKTDYYDWHVDSDSACRLLWSYILYLNDDFVGGDTLFLHQRLKVAPKKGSMLVFPCDFQTVHKSSPIREGQKNIIWTCMEYHV